MPRLTINRTQANDPIHLELMIFNPITSQGVPAVGLFDTGNDHTVISKMLSDKLCLDVIGRTLSIAGVTGASVAQTAVVTLGLAFDDQHLVTIDAHEVAVLDGVSSPVLIGRDFLERFDVTILRDGTFVLVH